MQENPEIFDSAQASVPSSLSDVPRARATRLCDRVWLSQERQRNQKLRVAASPLSKPNVAKVTAAGAWVGANPDARCLFRGTPFLFGYQGCPRECGLCPA